MALRLPAWLDALRPGQWVKNLLVGAGFFFALADRGQDFDKSASFLRTAAAIVLFCAVSGAVYLLNDLHDAERDRLHPVKCRRPIASGRLSRRAALAEAALLVAGALAGGSLLGAPFEATLAGYLALQLAYTSVLKRVPYLDVAGIALGFAMRVAAGVAAAGVALSPWILGCTFAGALFLAFGKRRGELAELGSPEAAAAHRPVLARYRPSALACAQRLSAAGAALCYAVWTLHPATIAKFGTHGMSLTLPFVLAGLARYLWLVERRGFGSRPETILTRDRPLQLIIVAYLLACATVWWS